MRLEGLGKLKKCNALIDNRTRPSGLQHNALTNYATACPHLRDIYPVYWVIIRYKFAVKEIWM
jgi:hypothetical protein